MKAGRSTILEKLTPRVRRFTEAIDCYQQSLPIRREIGDRYGEGSTLDNLGDVYPGLDRLHEAIDCYQQALAISREVGDRYGDGLDPQRIGARLQRSG